jgi:hypothetical protein
MSEMGFLAMGSGLTFAAGGGGIESSENHPIRTSGGEVYLGFRFSNAVPKLFYYRGPLRGSSLNVFCHSKVPIPINDSLVLSELDNVRRTVWFKIQGQEGAVKMTFDVRRSGHGFDYPRITTTVNTVGGGYFDLLGRFRYVPMVDEPHGIRAYHVWQAIMGFVPLQLPRGNQVLPYPPE